MHTTPFNSVSNNEGPCAGGVGIPSRNLALALTKGLDKELHTPDDPKLYFGSTRPTQRNKQWK